LKAPVHVQSANTTGSSTWARLGARSSAAPTIPSTTRASTSSPS
jgi:hypothetical protein